MIIAFKSCFNLVTYTYHFSSSKGKNAKTGTGLPHRRYSEPKTDMVDPQYFTASPVNMNHPVNSLSGSDGYVNMQIKVQTKNA
jgi:hypothetical protein